MVSDLWGLVAALAERDREPVFVLERSGRVAFSNPAARRLLEESNLVQIRDGALAFAPRRLQVALEQALGDPVPGSATETQHQRIRYRVSFSRVGNPSSSLALLVAVQQHSSISDFSRLLRQLVALTPAESEVAAHLCAGDSLGVVAAARGASVNTVKTQTRQIFQKVGVRSRVDLVRRLFELVTAQRGMTAAFSVPGLPRKPSSTASQLR